MTERPKEEIAISLKDVRKTFFIKEDSADTIKEYFRRLFTPRSKSKKVVALNNINLDIYQGEVFGIIGRNGSGKSTLLRIIMDAMKPDKGGVVSTNGRIIKLALGLGVDINLSARDNIYVNGSILGLSFKRIGSIFDEIIEFAGLEGFVDTPVKFFSSGMRQRLLFSIAMHADADIFLLDEFFGGTGDEDFRQKSDMAFRNKIMEGRTIVFVSHSLSTIRKHCERVLWLNKGEIQKLGPTEEVVKAYLASFPKPKK